MEVALPRMLPSDAKLESSDEMGADRERIQQEARAIVERYRQSGESITEAQTRSLEREIERALVMSWASQRVRQMTGAQISGQLRAVRQTIDRIAPAILRSLES